MKRNPFLVNFGKRVQAARTRAGLNQEELAHRSGVTQVAISLIENGRRSATLRTVEKLARALHVQPGALMPSITLRE